MSVRSLRGATTVSDNTADAMLEATGELLQTLVSRNGLRPEAVISALFTATRDLTAAYPAEAARRLGWNEAGLLCVQEMAVEGSLPACIRVLVLWETDKPQSEMQHSYLRGASGLRPDLD